MSDVDGAPDVDPEDGADALPSAQATVDAAAEPRVVKKRAAKRKLQEQEGEAFWRSALSTQTGRREIWKLLALCQAFDVPFQTGPNGFPQPEATWFKAGSIACGQRLYQKLARIDRAAVFLMGDEFDPMSDSPLKVKDG